MNVGRIKRILDDWNDSRQVYVRIVGGPDTALKIESIKKDAQDRLCINVRSNGHTF
jgi:hypothetical protein